MTKTTFAAIATPFIGRFVNVTAEGAETPARYKIVKLDEKLGTLKDGSKGEYVLLVNVDDQSVAHLLHPQSAKQLFTKGTSGAFEMIAEEVATEEPATPTAEAPAEAKAPSKKELAIAMFKEMSAAGKARKDVIEAFMQKAGLSKPGASTYYQNIKSGQWA